MWTINKKVNDLEICLFPHCQSSVILQGFLDHKDHGAHVMYFKDLKNQLQNLSTKEFLIQQINEDFDGIIQSTCRVLNDIKIEQIRAINMIVPEQVNQIGSLTTQLLTLDTYESLKSLEPELRKINQAILALSDQTIRQLQQKSKEILSNIVHITEKLRDLAAGTAQELAPNPLPLPPQPAPPSDQPPPPLNPPQAQKDHIKQQNPNAITSTKTKKESSKKG